MSAPILQPTAENIQRAAEALKKGEPAAFPTETVYGLGADARSDAAVANIYAVKNRPQFNPLICHMRDAAMAMDYVEWNEVAGKLAAAFWPGPLTLVLKRKDSGFGIQDSGYSVSLNPESRILNPISLLATAGLDTVAVRVPRHPVAQALIKACGFPLAAPSANRSGRVSPTTARHVAEEIGESIPLILDGGPCEIGIESTVVDCTDPAHIAILRPGAVTGADILKIISPSSWRGQALPSPPKEEGIKSPGRLASHYAPSIPLRMNVVKPKKSEALIAFGPDVPRGAKRTINLSERGDLKEAAANLFATLRALDSREFSAIAVMPIPEEGIGEAINDRLRRAAAR